MSSCKVGDEDPKISFRSRDKRIIGIWKFKYFINDTFFSEHKVKIKADGKMTQFNINNEERDFGNWRWLAKDDAIKNKEAFVWEDTHHSITKFIINRLSYKEIWVEYDFGQQNETKVYHTKFFRQD